MPGGGGSDSAADDRAALSTDAAVSGDGRSGFVPVFVGV